MRERTEKITRLVLLIMSILAVTGPAALGVGMMFISLVFCDSGPFQKCAEMGLMFLGGIWICAVLPVPAVVALIRNKGRLGWYMYLYPFLMLGLACVAYYIKSAVSLGMTKIILEYACLAVVAFAYVVLRRMSTKQGVPAGGPPVLPPAR
ncbi:hypothetical protein [Rhodanobacter koreensis]